MALPDLTGQNIQNTYQRVVQKDENGQLFDGTGSLIPLQIDGSDLIVSGAVRAQSYIVSESVTVVTSGSTVFGNSTDDTHRFTGSLNVSGSLSVDGVTTGDTNTYLRKSFVHKSNAITATTASFTAVTASAPTGLTATSENDFIFFLNGQYMEHDALKIHQAGATFQLHVDTDSIGYELEDDDEIMAMGKFNS